MTVYFSEGAELLRWTDEEWLAEARAWIDEQLRERGLSRTDDIAQVYVRSWSTVLRVPTERGALFFKASAPVQAVEVPLVIALAELRPDVVAPLAYDEERAWMLMRDGGTRLRELPQRRDHATWRTIVTQYADLQRVVAPHVDALVAIGVPDLRLDELPARFRDLVADEELLLVDREGGLTRREHDRLAAWTRPFAALCDTLAEYGVPETIEHNDLHDGNVFVRGGRAFFFDWGDASISHPFHSMRTTLAVVANIFGVPRGDALLADLRDAYLAGFGDVQELAVPFELAQRTAIVAKALTFVPFVSSMPPAFRRRYEHTIANVLRKATDAA